MYGEINQERESVAKRQEARKNIWEEKGEETQG